MHRRELLRLLACGGLAAATGCSASKSANDPDDLLTLDAIGQADLVAAGEMSAATLIEHAAERMRRVNPKINAVIYADVERALTQAETVDGLLGGLPYLIKDLNAYRDMPLTFGSRLFADNIATTQSPYTDRLDAAGLVVMGKTNTPEFGLLPSTEPALHGATRNPWNLNHTPGGSSGGAAAAVAARIVPAAQASDGGGSIRIPAAQCGLFGLKPSRGRFPDQGYDTQPWPISIKHAVTLSVRDSALLLALCERTDNSSMLPVGFVMPEDTRKKRIALSLPALSGAPDDDIAQAVLRTAQTLESLGHDIIPVEQTPLLDAAFNTHFLTLWASIAFRISQQVAERTGMPARDSGLLEPATTALAQLFTQLPASSLETAQRGLAQYEQTVQSFLGDYDAWLTPVTASAAPPIGYFAPDLDFDTLSERVARFTGYTPIHNAAGTPAMSIPAGLSANGLPIGVQIAAPLGHEATLLSIGYQLESINPWIQQLPPVHG